MRLFTSPTRLFLSSISPDGRRLAYGQSVPGSPAEIWTLPLDLSAPDHPIAGKPEAFHRGSAGALRATFSPDGRWLAFASQESGEFAVYVRPFPGPSGRWHIGPSGLDGPRWSRDGRQLFFSTSDGSVMVCDYETRGDTFIPGKPRLWTETRIGDNLGGHNFELSLDGQRILTQINPVDTTAQPANVHVTFLLNFFDELKRRLPN